MNMPPVTNGPTRQFEIYSRFDSGADNELVSFHEWEERARQVLEPRAFDYVRGGAGCEDTMRANRDAFSRWRVVPRMLHDVSQRTISSVIMGTPLAAPFTLAPVGALSVVHPDADRAVARAAAGCGIPYVLSTVASTTIEEVAQIMGDAPRWFQLYPGTNMDLNRSMVERAERHGYRAIIITLDTTMLGWRERDLRHRYLPFLQGQGLVNYSSDPVFRALLPGPPDKNRETVIQQWLSVFSNPGLSWSTIETLRRSTRLPMILKGILHPDDARLAVAHGVDGIIVSNHGGRQVDGAIAALDALPLVYDAIQGAIPILMDGGIRHGADVLKALALGARAVLLGRPYVYGLAVGGETGVSAVIRNLIAEIDLQMALSGRRSPGDIDGSFVVPA